MMNVIPPGHVDDVPVIEPNRHDDVPVVPKPILVDEDEDQEKEEFKEEEEPQEEEDDMEVDIEEDENELNVHEVGKSSTALFLQEDSDGLLTDVMEKLVERLGNVKDKVECKKLKTELEEARFNNTFFRMQNERVKRDLYWTRVQAHELYQEMIHRGFVFEERPNESIDVSVKDEERAPKESRGESS
nr:hypothetical protein [Tanacetum cinerariifolium]